MDPDSGHGAGSGAGPVGLRARAHSRGVPRARRRGHVDPAESRRGVRARSPAALVHAAHLHVSPRRLAAPDRQHVVPLGLREQRRGFDGPRPVPRVLSAVRPRRGRRADLREPRQRHPDGRRLGGDQRRDGRLRHPVSARAGAHAGVPVHLRHPHRGSGLPDARLLVPPPVARGQRRARRGRGRGRLLGARGRIRRRRAAHLGLQGSGAGQPAPRARAVRVVARTRLGPRAGGAWRQARLAEYVPTHVRPACPRRDRRLVRRPIRRSRRAPESRDAAGTGLGGGGAGQSQRRRAAGGHAAHQANGQEAMAGGVAAPGGDADGPDDAVGRRHARPGAPALCQGPPPGARGPARGDGRDPAADPGRRGLRLPHVRRDRGGGARGLRHSGGGGVHRVSRRGSPRSRSGSARSAPRWPRARRRSTS